jgi:hypothetical protein
VIRGQTFKAERVALPATPWHGPLPNGLLQRKDDVRVAGISDPGYAFTIGLTTHYGRGRGCTGGRGLGDGLGEE